MGAGRMFTVELYAGIRRAAMVDGLGRREAAKRFGITTHKGSCSPFLIIRLVHFYAASG
jgi:hypothetical protein